MSFEVKFTLLISITIVTLFGTLWYFFNWKPNAYFCNEHFPKTPTYICVFSNKYKYDND